MQAKDAWLTPSLDDVLNWNKPPLLYWAERAAYAVLGTNLFAARLPSALAWIALAMLLHALGRRMYGEKAGMAAALLTATAFGSVKYGRLAMMDAPMALGLTLAAYGTWRASEEDDPPLAAGRGRGPRRWTSWLKGPVGAVLVLLLSGGFLMVRNRPLLFSRWTAGAFLLGAILGLPWYVASFAVHGQAFYDSFFVIENIDRFRHPWTARAEASLLVGFLVFLLPWTFLFLGSLKALRTWREPGVLLPLFWVASVLVTFTIPSLKWPHYGLTAIPAAILLAVRVPPPRWALAATGFTLALLAAVSVLVLRGPLPSIPLLAIVAAALAFAASSTLAFGGRLAPSAAAAGAAFALIAVGLVVPGVNPRRSRPRPSRRRAAGRSGCSAPRPACSPSRRGDRSGGPGTDAEAESALAAGGAYIASESQVGRLSPSVRRGLVTLAGWRRIPGDPPAANVWRSWRNRDPGEVYESMSIVALPPASGVPLP